ncbi:MAG: energy-coupling factor transporter transmembrane component T [Anaerovoracaceae bacterium]|nr:energy-coupling factor transporter transmembrane component T [Anaerovoracaceae bacterium]
MLRDITLGQYYPSETIIHRLDPRVKIAATFLYLILIFVVRDFIGYAFVAAVLAAVTAVSRVPVKFMARGMKPIMFILVFTFIINLLVYKGTVLVSLGPITITDNGLKQAVFIAVRLVLLIFGTSLLTYTTKPMQLTDGFESIMRPLSRIGVPSHEIAMMMSIALRFIPVLLEEADKIMKAQQARGADFESGNLMKRAKSLIPLFIPLFVNAFRMAIDLARAMEARCYHGGEGRTSLHPMKLRGRDYAAIALTLLFAAAVIVQASGLTGLPMLWPSR